MESKPQVSGGVCPYGSVPCGSVCYVIGEKVCVGESVLCNPGQNACGKQCYNIRNQNCGAGNVICGFNEIPCKQGCYKPILGETCAL